MSEDCHDSNNENPFQINNGDMWPDSAFRLFDDPTIPCTECGEPVHVDEAYPVEINRLDGTTEVALFHRDFIRLCPLKWANKRLEKANENLNKVLDNYNEVMRQLKNNV
jgi:hypothetical protein